MDSEARIFMTTSLFKPTLQHTKTKLFPIPDESSFINFEHYVCAMFNGKFFSSFEYAIIMSRRIPEPQFNLVLKYMLYKFFKI